MNGREIYEAQFAPLDMRPERRADADVPNLYDEVFGRPALRRKRERLPVGDDPPALRVERCHSCKIGDVRYARLTVSVGPVVIEGRVMASTERIACPWWFEFTSDTAREEAEQQVLDAARRALRGGRSA